jgi:16S rRNA processing protein RimM
MNASPTNSNNPQESTGSPRPGESVFLVVGKLRRPHGVKGEIIMDVETDFPERLRRGKTIYVGEEHLPLKIQTIRPQNRAMLLSFAEYNDCDQVGMLRNFMVYVKAADLPALPAGEYYYHQLMNLKVVDEQGQALGVLTDILETGANDVYVVTSPEGGELLFPAIEDVLLGVDLEKQEIRVRPQDWS